MSEVRNAVIDSTSLGTGEQGFLDCRLYLDYGGSGQGFGGYALQLPKGWTHHKIEGVGGYYLMRVLEVAGVTDWDKLKGKTVRVRIENGLIKAIGHIVEDNWFCPADDFAYLKELKGEATE